MTEYHLYTSPSAPILIQSLCDCLVKELFDVLASKEQASLVVPGGTTPVPLFQILSRVDLPWHRVAVLLSDERLVPETDARSNMQMLRQNLQINHAENINIVAYVDEKGRQARDDLSVFLPIDICLVGMGTDMHTASLFPEGDNLSYAISPTCSTHLVTMRSPNAIEARITLNLNVLAKAKYRHLLIVGEAKKHALEQAQKLDNPLIAPISGLIHPSPPLFVHYTP